MDFSFRHTPSILLGRPDNSFSFLVFSCFGKLLEHSSWGFFTDSSRFCAYEPVFRSFFSVLLFIFVFEFEQIFKNDLKKIKFWTVLNLNKFKFKQIWIKTKSSLNKFEFEQIRVWTNSNLNIFEFEHFFEFEHNIRNWTDFELNKFLSEQFFKIIWAFFISPNISKFKKKVHPYWAGPPGAPSGVDVPSDATSADQALPKKTLLRIAPRSFKQ
jgi:hypothetical protein